MFLIASSVFLIGITLGLLNLFTWKIILLTIFALAIANYLTRGGYIKHTILILLILILGLYRGDTGQFERDAAFQKYIGNVISVTGTVATEPRERFATKDVVINIFEICITDICESVSTKVLTKVSPLIKVSLGDQISLQGRPDIPEPFAGETGRVFRYDLFLAKDDIAYILGLPKNISIIEEEVPTEYLFHIKWALVGKIDALFPHPESALAAGILLGIGKDFDKATEEMFRYLGLSHIIVLSGYNITLITHLFLAMLRGRVSWTALHLLIAIGMLIFCTMVGWSASVTRACLMAFIMLLARFIGHAALPLQALLGTIVVLAAMSPLSLLYDPAFQLTGLATLGLLIMATPFGNVLEKIKFPGLFRETLASTLAAQIAVLPVAMSLGSTLSFTSLLANMFILPIIPYGMIGSFVVATFALIAEPIGQLLLPFGYIPLRFVFILAKLLY